MHPLLSILHSLSIIVSRVRHEAVNTECKLRSSGQPGWENGGNIKVWSLWWRGSLSIIPSSVIIPCCMKTGQLATIQRYRQRSLISIIVFQLKTLLTHITHVWSIPQWSRAADNHPEPRVKQLDWWSQSWVSSPSGCGGTWSLLHHWWCSQLSVIRYKLWHARWGEAGDQWPRDLRAQATHYLMSASDRKWGWHQAGELSTWRPGEGSKQCQLLEINDHL